MIDMFRGGIAGAMLGYLIGLHYTLNDDQTTDKPIGPSLDWSWLVSPKASSEIVQTVLTCFFKVGYESFSTQSHQVHGKSCPQDVNGFTHGHLVNINNAHGSITPILDMLGTLSYVLDHHPASVPDSPKSTTLVPPIVSQHPLQSAFILLPLFLLYYDNTAQQQGWVESMLEHWQHPKAWSEEIKRVGLTLAQVMKNDPMASLYIGSCMAQPPTKGPSSEARTEYKELHGVDLPPVLHNSIHEFLYHSNNYDMGLLGLLHLLNASKENWAILPSITGLNGSLVGCKAGFSGLPLIWRHTITQHQQSLSPKGYTFQNHDAGVRLGALWSGQQKLTEAWHPMTSPPRTIT